MADAPDIPAQAQDSMPADEHKMTPAPDYMPRFPGVGKLKDKVTFISGGDSGIGRAIAVLFAREGAKIAIAFLEESKDAEETKRLVEAEGGEALLIPGDLGKKQNCVSAIDKTVEHFGTLDILINNAAQQWLDQDLRELDEELLRQTFDSNVMSYFFCTQAALKHMPDSAVIVNTSSINAFAGNASLVAYSATRGASVAFSRSMASQLASRNIRVNTVAPGPIWTPFIPGTMPAEEVEGFGSGTPLGRAGQPWEVATCFLFFASSDGNYLTGQTLHPNGGMTTGA